MQLSPDQEELARLISRAFEATCGMVMSDPNKPNELGCARWPKCVKEEHKIFKEPVCHLYEDRE